MKKIYLLFQLLLVISVIQVNAAPEDFVTTWDLTKTGSDATSITFGVVVDATNAVSYSWVSTSPASGGSGSIAGGSTTVTISGIPTGATDVVLSIAPTNFRAIKINNGTDKARLMNVSQWGTPPWNTMEGAFYGCSNLIVTATDVPDLSSVTILSSMFRDCSVLATLPDMDTWTTSNVQSMLMMFRGATVFNQDIGNWNVADVQNMSGMFQNASAFNQNLGAWTFRSDVMMNDMLNASGMDCAHYSATLIGWAENPDTPSDRRLGAQGIKYGTNAADSRTTLVDKGWIISDGGSSGTTCILSSLPVALISFSAREAEGGAALRWETSSEVGASHFEIERSADAQNFTKTGHVEALGNRSMLHRYTFSDDLSSFMTPVVYYRLRSVDLDESFSVSRVIALQRTKEYVHLGIYPNPVLREGKVILETNAPQVQVRLLDLLGRQTVFSTIQTTNGKAELDLAGVKSGLYIIQLDSAGGLASGKLVVN